MSANPTTASVTSLTKAMMYRSKPLCFRIVLCAILFCHVSLTLAQPVVPDAALKLFEAGMANVERQQYQAAIAAFTQAIAAHAPFVEAYQQRSQAHGHLGNLELAIADCSQAIALAPNSAHAYNCRGNAYTQAGRRREAIADYRDRKSVV